MKTSGTTRNNEWQRITTSDNEWQRMTTSDNEWSFRLIFIFSNKTGTYHNTPKETYQTLRKILKRHYWIKSRKKSPRRNINRKKEESRQFSCLWCKQRCTISEDSMTLLWSVLAWYVSIWDSPWILIRMRELLWENNFS